ncbi:cell death-inducing p53-target protein 1-like [Thunnus maccoyii]|uniref:cell death-inducing p53-target protein 1-like n=1 Tax=Thunnus maccoyii TaxID=8240 RepID=UPI001C4A9C3F|nr:cell death-inducing p53-target protein 1-like [Thunnus maccoyii]
MKHLSLKRQQLLERRKILCIFQELRSRAEFGQTEEAASNQHEIDGIDNTLKQIIDTIADLQKSYDNILKAKEQKSNTKKGVSFAQSEKDEKVELEFNAPGSNIFYVVAPPSVPAPEVILDVENLPPCPCKTQCPECRQFITTEIVHSISSVTWLVCFMTALIGCVAGCCLIPFCLKRFKSITHKCPNCRSSITTIKKL